MKQIIFFISIFLFSISKCFCQNYSLSDFEKYEIPKSGSKEWYDFNHSSDKEFVFTLKSGKIQITKYKYIPHTEFDIPDGKLISVNMGEFGGGLYYKPKDSTKNFSVNGKNSKDIKARWFGGLMATKGNPITNILKNAKLLQSGNIGFIFKFNDSIRLLGGVAHMSLNSGNLQTLSYNNNSFIISKTLNLKDAPSAMYVYNDFIYLAGHKGFYIIDKNLKVKTIFDNLFWEGLYPTSVLVINKQTVYITIRGGYVKMNPEKKRLTLYKAK